MTTLLPRRCAPPSSTPPASRFASPASTSPVPARGQVLVRILASGVNPLDTKIRAGQAAHARQPLPSVLGHGPGRRGRGGRRRREPKFRRGDEVYGMAGGIGGLQGTLAEYAAVDADLLALKPHTLGMREAAGPAAGVHHGVRRAGRPREARRPARRCWCTAARAASGTWPCNWPVSLGAEVFATGSPAQADTIRRFGATPIDHTATSVEAYVARHTAGEGFDVVYDTVGGAVLDASFEAARRYGGHVVSCLGLGHAQAGAAVVPRGDLLGRVHAAADDHGPRPRAPRRDPGGGGAAGGGRAARAADGRAPVQRWKKRLRRTRPIESRHGARAASWSTSRWTSRSTSQVLPRRRCAGRRPASRPAPAACRRRRGRSSAWPTP
jgi:NADPH:quinone reductase-like Zn-dependent oxidoreductase